MTTSIKTIDVSAKEWFDKSAGNSYFSGQVVLDYGTDTEKVFYIPFQYGYGSQYEYAALSVICNNTDLISQGSLSATCREYGITLRRNMQENCKKRDVEQFGKLQNV